MHPQLRDSMHFLYMEEGEGYVEVLATVYDAEAEGSEGKVLNVKAKAMTVEKIIDNKEQNELKDLRQQIESLATIMKSDHCRECKTKSYRVGFLPHRRKKCLVSLLRKDFKDHPEKGKGL